MRAAGQGSALGHVSPQDYGRVLRTSTWKVTYNEASSPKRETETRAVFHSTMRANTMTAAAREVLANPLMDPKTKEELRHSSINVGFDRPEMLEGRWQTYAKSVFTEQPLPKLQSAAENKERQQKLQESHIDLAYGKSKSGKTWQTDQSAHQCAKADAKFACEGRASPAGHANYKSQVQFGDNTLGAPVVDYVTETKCQYAPFSEIPEVALNYAATRGKELQAHSWDHAMGREKSTKTWIPAQTAEYARKAEEKYLYAQVKPEVDPSLARALRSSSVYVGKNSVNYESHTKRVQRLAQSQSSPSLVGVARR